VQIISSGTNAQGIPVPRPTWQIGHPVVHSASGTSPPVSATQSQSAVNNDKSDTKKELAEPEPEPENLRRLARLSPESASSDSTGARTPFSENDVQQPVGRSIRFPDETRRLGSPVKPGLPPPATHT